MLGYWTLVPERAGVVGGPEIHHRRTLAAVEPVAPGVVRPLAPSARDISRIFRSRNASLTSDQVGLPAELKHINKRRKRNLRGFP